MFACVVLGCVCHIVRAKCYPFTLDMSSFKRSKVRPVANKGVGAVGQPPRR